MMGRIADATGIYHRLSRVYFGVYINGRRFQLNKRRKQVTTDRAEYSVLMLAGHLKNVYNVFGRLAGATIILPILPILYHPTFVIIQSIKSALSFF